jgi:Core-2/I-Branching enzyme
MPGLVYFIQAHHKPRQLQRLVATLHAEMRSADRILIHYDGDLAADAFARFERVSVLPRRDVQWGHISQVDLALAAIDHALAAHDPDWLVYISGQDYPLRTAGAIAEHLERSELDGFIAARPVEALRWQLGGGRYLYRYPGWSRFRAPGGMRRLIGARNAWLTVRGTAPRLNLWRDGERVYVGVRRHPFSPEFRCWTGSPWWTLSRRALRHVLAYADRHPDYRDHFMRVAFASDEAFFNTILANAASLRIEVADNLRYVRFDDPDSGHPRTLTSEDAARVLRSGRHFARKLDLDVDERLFDLIDADAGRRARPGLVPVSR